MRKVLIITYHYPPGAAVGALRAAKFAKYLPEFGWQPIILTVDQSYYDLQDRSSPAIDEKKDIVVRTRMLRHPSYYYRRCKEAWLRRSERPERQSESRPRKTNMIAKVLRGLGVLISFPDEEIGWCPYATRAAIRIARRHKIRALITSGPPHSVHCVGACLTKYLGLPWIADLRDPFADDWYLPNERDFKSLKRLVGGVEWWILNRATIIVTTTRRLSELLGNRYPKWKHKLLALPNGYDLNEFKSIRKGKEERFTISHIGSIYLGRDPGDVLRAVGELIQEGDLDPSRVRVRFIGESDSARAEVLRCLVRAYELDDNVELIPWVSRAEALEMMVRSHVLLLLAQDQPLAIPGKVFEYLGSGSEIVAITGDGATRDLLREVGRGNIVGPGDYKAMKKAIALCYGAYREEPEYEQRRRGEDLIADYDRRELTRQLAAILGQAGRGV